MDKKIILFDRLHVLDSIKSDHQKNAIINRYEKYLAETTKGFPNSDVSIKKIRQFDKRPEVLISGPERVFIYNMLKSEIGVIHDFSEVKVGDTLKGLMVDVGKVGFGIFVDCGIFQPNTDVLLSLHALRDQLCGGKKLPVRKIIQLFGFFTNFPLFVKITRIDARKHEIEGEIDKKSLNLFQKIVEEDIEGLAISGETKGQFKKALIKKGHLRDIISLERYTFLEHIVLLKEGTNAPGIISTIGKSLDGCKLSAIRASKIKRYY